MVLGRHWPDRDVSHRLSRDQEDIAHVYKRTRFAGVRIVTLSEGEVSTAEQKLASVAE
jgi:hypothetical protein